MQRAMTCQEATNVLVMMDSLGQDTEKMDAMVSYFLRVRRSLHQTNLVLCISCL